MRTRVRVSRGIALLALLVVVSAPGLYADDPPSPLDPPEARIKPPSGLESDARIHPPVGATSGASFFKIMLEWFLARINPPVG